METVIARACLSFGSCKGIFFARFRMNEHGKVLADTPVTQLQELLRRCTHDAPVVVADGQPELLIPQRASNKVNFHVMILTGNPDFAPLPSAGNRNGGELCP